MAEKPALAWRITLKRRLIVAVAVLVAWSAAIEARLVYLQVGRHADLMARAERQQLRTVETTAKRGDILDRSGRVLAYSVEADSIYAVPTDISDPAAAAAALCGALEDCGFRERQALARRIRDGRAFAYVRRQVSPDEARRVAALELEGVGFMKENRRFYPNRDLAAHVLGYVGIDNTGLSGLEAAYDTIIKGRPGTVLIQTDARRQAFSRVERPPTTGATLELTIDQYLQHVAERELRAGVEENRAASGTAVVMDPRTGEILALANWPSFNPNAYREARPDAQRNRAIQDLYEPGSTFKIVTASAALEEHVVEPDDPIDVSAGQIRFGARVIDDSHRLRVLSFTDVIVKSSNVGAIKVGLKLGPERLGLYMQRFGFGRRSSPDFPGESSGIVWDPVEADRQRPRVGVDGLPGGRDAAADGCGRQLDCQRRRAVRAARRPRGDCRRQAHARAAQDGPSDCLRRHGGAADGHHGAGRRAGNGDPRESPGFYGCRQDRHRAEGRQRPVFEVRLQRVVRGLRSFAPASLHDRRRHRFAAREEPLLRRLRGSADLPADRRGGTASQRCASLCRSRLPLC